MMILDHFRQFCQTQQKPKSNDFTTLSEDLSVEQDEIFESRKKKVQEICKKYNMTTGKPSQKIFNTAKVDEIAQQGLKILCPMLNLDDAPPIKF